MDELKVQSPGFDYHTAKDDEGRPIGIQYDMAFCLDVQKHQMNSSG
jgi:hypothetical protein